MNSCYEVHPDPERKLVKHGFALSQRYVHTINLLVVRKTANLGIILNKLYNIESNVQ